MSEKRRKYSFEEPDKDDVPFRSDREAEEYMRKLLGAYGTTKEDPK